jgi:hypothetical protein
MCIFQRELFIFFASTTKIVPDEIMQTVTLFLFIDNTLPDGPFPGSHGPGYDWQYYGIH